MPSPRFPIVFRDTTPHGILVAVALPDPRAVPPTILDDLSPEEQALAARFAPRRRATFAGGRAALRCALSELGVDVPSILRDARGAPAVPAGLGASITHKDTVAAGLAVRLDDDRMRVGVDLELLAPLRAPRTSIAPHVLTPAELASLAPLDDDARDREVLLRFSLKEALYKALDPFVRRYVGFQEVEVAPHSDGSATFTLDLVRGEGPFIVDGAHQRRGDIVVTTARVRSR